MVGRGLPKDVGCDGVTWLYILFSLLGAALLNSHAMITLSAPHRDNVTSPHYLTSTTHCSSLLAQRASYLRLPRVSVPLCVGISPTPSIDDA